VWDDLFTVSHWHAADSVPVLVRGDWTRDTKVQNWAFRLIARACQSRRVSQSLRVVRILLGKMQYLQTDTDTHILQQLSMWDLRDVAIWNLNVLSARLAMCDDTLHGVGFSSKLHW
jgi:hypothetical protein